MPGAPFVVTASKGGYPDFIVPWRDGTRLRAARREDLLRILVPVRRIAALIDELDFNRAIIKSAPVIASLGALFSTDEFRQARRDGLLSGLPTDVRTQVTNAYVAMDRVNSLVSGAINSALGPEGRTNQKNHAWQALKDSAVLIDNAYAALSTLQ